jgi:serine/threonine protein kinase
MRDGDNGISMSAPDASMSRQAGKDLIESLYSEYRVLAYISGGAYGHVWLAAHTDGTLRAIKFVAAAPDGVNDLYERERRGLRLLKSLREMPDSIIAIHDLREQEGIGFAYVMDLADPERTLDLDYPDDYRPRTMQSEITARRALPLIDVLEIGIRLAEALDFLQRYRLVHRDIKPANVLFVKGRPVLADVGLLADTRDAASIVGTPGYVPEEQHGAFSGDIFSLGILLTEISTGRPAAEAGYSPVEEADTEAPLFADWLAILRRACAPKAGKRYQTAAAFLRDLMQLRERLSQKKPASRFSRQWVAAVLALAGAVWLLWHYVRREPIAPASEPEPPAPVLSDLPASRPRAPVQDPDGSSIQYVDRRGHWLEHVERSPDDRANAARRTHFHVPADFIEANGFLHVYEDVVLVYAGDESGWQDWRMTFSYSPVFDQRSQPLLLRGPPARVEPDAIPSTPPIRAWPAASIDRQEQPQFAFEIPAIIFNNPPPHAFPRWIFLTTKAPDHVEQLILTYFAENPEFRNPQPFYFFQRAWIDLHGLRYEEP